MAHAREWISTDGPVKVELIHEDDGAGNHQVIRHVQDATPIAEQAKRLAQHEQHGTTGGMQAKLAAKTPVLWRFKTWPMEFQQKHGVHPEHPDLSNVPRHEHTAMRKEIARKWDKFRRDKMNARDFQDFRVWKGRL